MDTDQAIAEQLLESPVVDTRRLNRNDLDQSRKTLSRIMKTPEGLQALQDVTGLTFGRAAAEETVPTVVMLVPSHNQPEPETQASVNRVINDCKDVCKLLVPPSVSSSIVHWVRNDIYSKLLKSGQKFDYVCYMDDDMVPAPDSVRKLLAANVDVIAAACTVRQDPPKPNFRVFNKETMRFHVASDWNGDGVMPIAGAGTGMILIKKEVMDKVGEYYLTCQYEQKYFGMSADFAAQQEIYRRKAYAENTNAWWFQCLNHPYGDGEYGEDISFSLKCMELGIQMYVDTTIRPGHIGRYPFSLNDWIAQRDEYRSGKKQTVIAEVPQAT